MIQRLWMIVMTMGVLASVALAGTGRLQFVETDVILYPNGQAGVKYTVRYKVLSGEFHGFYFDGLDRLTAYFDTETAFGNVVLARKTFHYDVPQFRQRRRVFQNSAEPHRRARCAGGVVISFPCTCHSRVNGNPKASVKHGFPPLRE